LVPLQVDFCKIKEDVSPFEKIEIGKEQDSGVGSVPAKINGRIKRVWKCFTIQIIPATFPGLGIIVEFGAIFSIHNIKFTMHNANRFLSSLLKPDSWPALPPLAHGKTRQRFKVFLKNDF
jgi:hypothetical protein